jgi:CRP/FNR family cyclic AMP-dependent transcriptional regulator
LNISQDMLATIVGTTRPRIKSFMKKLKTLGFIDTGNRLHVHQALNNILLRDYIPVTR